MYYFGGNQELKSSESKTKIRQIAHKIKDKLVNADQVLISGHHFGDYDSIAASFGIAALARFFKKEARVIIDFDQIDIKARRYIQNFLEKSYIKAHTMTRAEAAREVKKDTLVFALDTSDPTRLEAPELVRISKNIVVLDHHRVGKKIIKNIAIEYIEPSCSSTSEIVSEIIYFLNLQKHFSKKELTMLYTGLVLDTNNFKSSRVSASTLNAAYNLKH